MVAATGRRWFAESSTAAPATALTLNLCTPHQALIKGKVVDKVLLPGETGEYGVTVGHSPLISQLKPGLVTVIHTGGEAEKFFVAGGFALTHANSVTDVSVTEAYPLADLDEAAIRAGYAEATKGLSAADGSAAKATAQVEVTVFTSLARALGFAL
jgi:ATP synthase F1 epsilon subunit